jgi:CHAT domain-containing protein
MIKRFIIWIALGLLLSLGLAYPTPATDSVQRAKTAYDAGQYGTAIESLEFVLKQPQNPLEQAQTYGWLSLAQQKLGQWEQAQVSLDKSFALIESLAQTDAVRQVQGQIYNAQGQLNLLTGHPETALDAWQKAEQLYQGTGDRIGVLGSQINQTKALQVLGLYRRAENLLKKIEQDLQEQSDTKLKTYGLQSIGEIRRLSGDLVQSQEILQQALTLVQSPLLESQLRLSLGNTELARGRQAIETKEAQTHFRAALAEYRKVVAIAPTSLTKVQGLLNQLNLFLKTEQFSEAKALISPIQESLQQIPPSRAAIYAHVNFASSLILLKSPIAPQILATAIGQAQALQDRRAESYALGTLGKFYEQQREMEKARQTTQEALLIAQSIDAPEIAYQWQWQLGRILPQPDEAILAYTQAFNTLNVLRSDLVALNPEIQFSFREQVEPVYRELVDRLLQDREPSQENLRQARQVIEALQVAELDNFFRDACTQVKPSSIETIDPHAAIVYPIILENRLEIILQLPNSEQLYHTVQQGVTVAQLDTLVQQLRSLLNRRSSSPEQIKQTSGALYNWIIQPFEPELKQNRPITTLVFILEGSLRNLPMAVLHDGEKYLIEHYAIAVTPSLQLLAPKPLKKESLMALVAGAVDAPSFEQEGLGTLDNVASELSGIEREVQQTQPLENQNFLQENIQQQINRIPFNIVHLATHGKFSSNPEETYLLDWNKRIGVKDLDVLLRSQTREQPIELLILSACETATGDKRAALGLAGVAIRAGARSTLATLWQINDASTAQFMLEFYQQLQNPNITKAEALRNVQLSFLGQSAETDYNRPYHWAAFILVGNWL